MTIKKIFIIQVVICFISLVVFSSYAKEVNIANGQEQKIEINKSGDSDEDAMDIIVVPPQSPLAHFDLPAFSSITSDADPHFVKTTISLAYEQNSELSKELINKTEEIRHIINILLRLKKYKDIKSPAGMVDLSEEIKAHINLILTSAKIKEVYFKEFIIN